MRAREPERLIDADWGKPRDEVFPVDVVLEAMDRQGLLRDVTEVLSREQINVTAANTLTRNMQTRMAFTLEVKSLDALARALLLVKDVKGVLSARAALTGLRRGVDAPSVPVGAREGPLDPGSGPRSPAVRHFGAGRTGRLAPWAGARRQLQPGDCTALTMQRPRRVDPWAGTADRVAEFQPDVIIIGTESPTRDVLEHIVGDDGARTAADRALHRGRAHATIQAALKAGVSAYVVAGIQADRLQGILDVAVARFAQEQALREELRSADRSSPSAR